MTAHQIDSFTKATTMEGQETTLITDYVLRLCVLLLFGVNFLACRKKKHINIEKEFDLSHLYTCEVFAVTGAKIGSKLRIWSIYGGHGQVTRTKQPHLACFLRAMEKMGKDFLPFVVMVFVQFGFAGFNILSKLVIDGGMNPLKSVRNRPKLTPSILFQIFLCSIFGLTGNQYAFFYGLKNSTPTIATALDNLIPAFTFLLAVPVGLEKLRLKNISGQAKILGTMLCVGGAMLLSLYHGKVVIGQLGFHWKYAESTGKVVDSANGNFFSGPFLVIISSLTYALWLIIQTRVNEKYAAPYTCTALMCLMASIECLIIGFCVVHNTAEWALNPIRAISVLYNGIVCTSVIYYLSSWCIEKKGPLHVSMFNPLLLVISSFLSWILFREKLYIGTVGGPILTVVGLYVFFWGQKKEMELITKDVEKENHSSKVDLQLELHEIKESKEVHK